MQNRLGVSPSGAVQPGSEELVQGTKPLQSTLVNRKTHKIGPTAVNCLKGGYLPTCSCWLSPFTPNNLRQNQQPIIMWVGQISDRTKKKKWPYSTTAIKGFHQLGLINLATFTCAATLDPRQIQKHINDPSEDPKHR